MRGARERVASPANKLTIKRDSGGREVVMERERN